MSVYDQPPEHLTSYHAGALLDAEDGLTYDTTRWAVHGVSNNAVACLWCGLLVDAPGGPVLTKLGRTMLAQWRASQEGAEDGDEGEDSDDDREAAAPGAPPPGEQLGLFTEMTR